MSKLASGKFSIELVYTEDSAYLGSLRRNSGNVSRLLAFGVT